MQADRGAYTAVPRPTASSHAPRSAAPDRGHVAFSAVCRRRFEGVGELTYYSDASVKCLFEDRCIAKLKGELLSLLLPSGDTREALIGFDRDYERYSRPMLEFKVWMEMGPRRQDEWRTRAVRDGLLVSQQLRDIELYLIENRRS